MNNAGNQSTSEFDDFVASGDVEVGSEVAAEREETPAPKRRGPPKTKEVSTTDELDAADTKSDERETDQTGADDQQEIDQDEIDEDEGEIDEDDKPKKQRKPSERIRELTRKLRDRDRLLETALARLDRIENSGLQPPADGGSQAAEKAAPDPSDTDKYPLGHLDDRYIEDKLDWLAEKKAAERADAVLQRQQENEQRQQAERQQQELLVKVDDLATRGTEAYDDFTESVVEAGMRGDWALDQPTFEAAHEAENGAQILYELSRDKAEAKRVANLTPYQQLKFVQARDAEISASKQPRRVPRAGTPPENTARGANSRMQISPATDNLDDFEKAWMADAKKSR